MDRRWADAVGIEMMCGMPSICGDLAGKILWKGEGGGKEREERVRVGVRRDKKEREEFLRGVDRAKVEEGKKRKREGKREKVKEQRVEDEGVVGGEKQSGFERRFRQNEVRNRKKVEGQPDEVNRVLGKIF